MVRPIRHPDPLFQYLKDARAGVKQHKAKLLAAKKPGMTNTLDSLSNSR